MNSPAPGNQTWPVDRFYWAVLEAPGYTRSGPLPPGLRPLMDDETPVPVDSLQAVAAPLDRERLLVCAAAREELQGLGTDVLRLTPESVPDFAAGADLGSLNLLVGQFEPLVLRRARSQRHLLGMAACLMCSALASLGLLRRAQHWTQSVTLARNAESKVLGAVSVPSADALSMELLHLRGSAHPATLSHKAPDAAVSLSSLLAKWPRQVPCKPQFLAVNASGISVALTVEGDPGPFLKAFRPPRGWSADEPHLNTAGGITRVNLQLRPEGAKR